MVLFVYETAKFATTRLETECNHIFCVYKTLYTYEIVTVHPAVQPYCGMHCYMKLKTGSYNLSE